MAARHAVLRRFDGDVAIHHAVKIKCQYLELSGILMTGDVCDLLISPGCEHHCGVTTLRSDMQRSHQLHSDVTLARNSRYHILRDLSSCSL